MDAPELKVWLQTTLSVEASVSTCQTWRTKDWSTSGKLLSIDRVEEAIGERLRLSQYKEQFTESAAPSLVAVLQESSPPVAVTALLLLQWYAKYHPDAGPLRIHSAVELEQYLGDDIRRQYPYFSSRQLQGALEKRRRPVLLSRKVAETWLAKYAPRRISFKRSGAVVWGIPGDEPAAKRARVSGDPVLLSGAGDIEAECGDRYRSEVSDLGLGERFFIPGTYFLFFLFLI